MNVKRGFRKLVNLFGVHKRKSLPRIKQINKIYNSNSGLKLADIFINESKYNYIIQLLIEREMIAPGSHFWIDFTKGNKTVIIALLKYLHVQGYYKNNQKLTNKQIQDICLNTFGVKISIDYIKHIQFKDIIFNYILPAAQ